MEVLIDFQEHIEHISANTLHGLLAWSPCGVLDSNKQTKEE